MSENATEDKAPKPRGGMRAAAIIQLVSRYASVAVQFVILAILARLISPEESGIQEIVTVFTAFFAMFSDMGISTAIVQFRDLTKDDHRALFGFSIVLACGITLVFCALALPISWAYGIPSLAPLCAVGSLSLLFSTLNMVPNGLMLRDRRFSQIGLRLVVATFVSGVVGVALAYLGWGSYALVIQAVTSAFVVLAWNLANCAPGLPSFHFMGVLKKVFSYSAYQFAFSLVNYFNRNLDNLLIGKVAGPEALGYYGKAYKLTTYPMSSFSSVIASVVQPFMAEHQDDRDVIFATWLRVVKLCSLVGMAIAVVMFTCSEEIIRIVYGERWLASIPLLHALSISVYAQMVANPTGAFFQSLGHTDLMFRCGICNTAIMVAGIVGGLALGDVNWVARLVSCGFFAQLMVISHFLIRRGFGRSVRELRVFLPEVAGGIVAAAAGSLAGSLLPAAILPQLAGKLVVSLAVLGAAYAVGGQMDYLRSLVRR